MQTTDNTQQPTVHDGLDEFFAAVLEDELPNPCCASRVEMLPMPAVIEDGLFADFE